MTQQPNTPQTKRILGHLRIFQAVFNDLKMRHEIVTLEDGTKRYAYVYDGVDPYALEDGHFPGTVSIIQDEILKAQLQSIDKVFELSPKGSFQSWKPIDAFHFYERLKAYERELLSQLNQPNTNNEIFGMKVETDPDVPLDSIRFDHPGGRSEGFTIMPDGSNTNKEE